MKSLLINNYFGESVDIEMPEVVNDIIDDYFSEKKGRDLPEFCRKRCPGHTCLGFDEVIKILQNHEDNPEVASYLDKLYTEAIHQFFSWIEHDGVWGLMVSAIKEKEFTPKYPTCIYLQNDMNLMFQELKRLGYFWGDEDEYEDWIEDCRKEDLDNFRKWCMRLPREKAIAIMNPKDENWSNNFSVYRDRECFAFEIDVEYTLMPMEEGQKAAESKICTFEVSECLAHWLMVDYDNHELNSSEYSLDNRFVIGCDYNQVFSDSSWWYGPDEEFQEFLDKVYAECYFHPTKGRDILQQKEKIWLVRDLGDSYYRPQKSFGDFKREEQLPLIGTSLLHFDEEKCWNRYLDSLLPEYRKFFENLSDEERYNRYQITYYDWNPTRVYDWKAIDIRLKNI